MQHQWHQRTSSMHEHPSRNIRSTVHCCISLHNRNIFVTEYEKGSGRAKCCLNLCISIISSYSSDQWKPSHDCFCSNYNAYCSPFNYNLPMFCPPLSNLPIGKYNCWRLVDLLSFRESPGHGDAVVVRGDNDYISPNIEK